MRGVYQDKYGIGIPIRGKEHRYPLGTPTEQLIDERNRLRDEAGAAPSRRGTIGSDADAYLETIPEGKSRATARSELQPWVVVFGTRASGDLKSIEIKQQRAAWLTKGPKGKPLSKKHLNNMLYRFRAMFKAVHGKEINPAADVEILTVRYDDERAISSKLIDLILDGMPDQGKPRDGTRPTVSLAKLRLRVMRYTGLSQAMLKRVEPHHLDFRKKTMYVTTRLKGAGVEAATLKMIDEAVEAWRALNNAGGLGTFSTRSLAQAWRRAVERAKKQWIAEEAKKSRPRPWPLQDGDRAYDLRHTFGTWALIATGGDLQATAEMMRHRNLNTTRRYTKGAAKALVARAVAKMNRSRGI